MIESINVIQNKGMLVVSSREVAENFERRHDHIIRDIENLKNGFPQNWGDQERYFIEGQYQNQQNKQFYKEYFLTRDGFTLLVMGFTGTKAVTWKMKYIDAFNKMEEELRDPYKHLSTELKAIFVIDKKSQEIEGRVEVLENRMTIDYGQQLILQELAKGNAIKAMNGVESNAYKNRKLRGKVFSKVWKDYKDYFEVNSYRNTSKKDFDKAKEYLKGWKPQGKLLRDIEQCMSGI